MFRTLTSIFALSIACSAYAHPGDDGTPAEEAFDLNPQAMDAPAPTAAEGEAEEESDKGDEKWDVAKPPVPTRSINIDVDEGTWMNVDVSPDGKTIAFDMLGDIYTMPITGGTATSIASGIPYEQQPRFSRDGTKIAFTSDRAGGDNVWIMNIDGSDKRQVTKESFRLLNNPPWSPDGDYIVAKKHMTTSRSAGTGEIWMYNLGGGSGVQLVKRPSESYQKEIGEPVFSPDGEYVYFTRATSSGNAFTYAQDSNQQAFAIDRYELATGETERVVSGAGGSVRSQPSPDGKSIAFVRRERGASKLYIKDFKSGKERKVFDQLDLDMQETWGVYGLYPTMDWTPDSGSIVFWAGGKIQRVNVKSGAISEIPFKVSDTRELVDPPRPQVEVAPDNFDTKMPRFATMSPDGSKVLFESLGKIYVRNTSNGATRRLTSNGSDTFEVFPSWSRDGRKIVYATWNDEKLGSIYVASASGGGARKITSEPGHYRRPSFSPDGRNVVYEKDSGGFLTSGDWSENTGIYSVSANGGKANLITTSGSGAHFGADNDRVFLSASNKGARELVSYDFSGNEKRVHATGKMVTSYQVAPTGKHIAFGENYSVYVMPMAPGPQQVGAGMKAGTMPVTKASDVGATYFNWTGKKGRLNWSLGPTLYSSNITEMLPSMPKGEEEVTKYEPPTSGVDISMNVKSDKPSGTVALVGARIITMASDDGGVIEDGVILINSNRIQAIGSRDDVNIPTDMKTVDVSGKTITPGFIDAHAHGPHGSDDIIPQKNWNSRAHLAFGVTTIHDPSNSSNHIFPSAEMQRAGVILAPRIYSTAEIVYGAKSPFRYALINNLDDARAHVKRLKAQGAHAVKNYNQPRREQRQQVVAAAIEENIAVVAEGGSLFGMDMALIADGNTTLEHNIPQADLYEDVLSFYGQSKVGYTPTLTVTYGGLAGDPYWRYATDVWTHPILSQHVPPHILQPKSVRRTKAPEEDFADQVSAKTSKLLADRGVQVSIGAHGQEEGLAAHWEMWSFARGGFSPLEALKTATSTPAKALGFDRDIGTLEKGKLADLVILNENPLDDILNSDKIHSVMINGRLYDPVTLDEMGTGSEKQKPYYWE